MTNYNTMSSKQIKTLSYIELHDLVSGYVSANHVTRVLADKALEARNAAAFRNQKA